MDFNRQGMTYVFMLIPMVFACAVLGQGIYKLSKQQPDGKVAVGFGIFLILLIITAYFLFIR